MHEIEGGVGEKRLYYKAYGSFQRVIRHYRVN